MSLRALAVDFGGTLARSGPQPDGQTVARVLADRMGVTIPIGFSTAVEAVQQRVWESDRRSMTHTAFAEVLRQAAERCGAALPDPVGAAEAVFMVMPDAHVDQRAAHALRLLRKRGLVCVLACDTQRPETVRRRTLHTAGVADCFDALVLSSTLGLRKPHPEFYAAVINAAGCSAEEIMFVGDTPVKDAVEPRAFGMSSILVAPTGRPDGVDEKIPVVPAFAALPSYLEDAVAR